MTDQEPQSDGDTVPMEISPEREPAVLWFHKPLEPGKEWGDCSSDEDETTPDSLKVPLTSAQLSALSHSTSASHSSSSSASSGDSNPNQWVQPKRRSNGDWKAPYSKRTRGGTVNTPGGGRSHMGRGRGRGGRSGGRNNCQQSQQNGQTSSYRQVEMNRNYYNPQGNSTAQIRAQETKTQLDNLKNKIAEVAPWPKDWRTAVEAGWALGRINQASALRVFSRAFYKFVELACRFRLIPPLVEVPSMKTAHLGEAPGGFFQGFTWTRHGILGDYGALDTDDSIVVSLPTDSWPPEIATKSGIVPLDMLGNPDEIEQFCLKYADSRNLVTADGGIEVPPEERIIQEQQMLPLIEAEVRIARRLLKVGGTLVLKMFAIDTPETRSLLLEIFCSFGMVHLVTPESSKPSNDERFIVAQFYLPECDRTTLTPEDRLQWQEWLDQYCTEDKMAQYQPIEHALAMCAYLRSPGAIVPREPGLSQAIAFCRNNGLPVKPPPVYQRASSSSTTPSS